MTSETAAGICRNCDTSLQGDYCHHCGQRESTRDHQFMDLAGDLAGDLFEWDSRFWRTLLPLLFRPGFLTAEFIAGRKARYMPPLRLYLVISFVMFLLLSLQDVGDIEAEISADMRSEIMEGLDERLAGRIERGDITEEDAEKIRQRVEAHFPEGGGLPIAITAEGESVGVDELVNRLLSRSAPDDGGEPAERAAAEAGDRSVIIDLWEEGEAPSWGQALERRLERNVEAVQQDPGQLVDDLIERLPFMMFLMLPLFALLVQSCYLFSGFHYLQHLVFALHFHSALFLVLAITLALAPFSTYEWGNLAMIYAMLYMPLALVKSYGSSYAGAIGKALLICLLDLVLLVFTVAGLVVTSLAVL